MNMVEIWLHLYSSGMVITADQLPDPPGGPGGGGSPKYPVGLAKQHSHGGTDPKGMKSNRSFHCTSGNLFLWRNYNPMKLEKKMLNIILSMKAMTN